MVQVLANNKTSILFPTIYYMINEFLHKKSFSLKDKEINKLLSLIL